MSWVLEEVLKFNVLVIQSDMSAWVLAIAVSSEQGLEYVTAAIFSVLPFFQSVTIFLDFQESTSIVKKRIWRL